MLGEGRHSTRHHGAASTSGVSHPNSSPSWRSRPRRAWRPFRDRGEGGFGDTRVGRGFRRSISQDRHRAPRNPRLTRISLSDRASRGACEPKLRGFRCSTTSADRPGARRARRTRRRSSSIAAPSMDYTVHPRRLEAMRSTCADIAVVANSGRFDLAGGLIVRP